jgi:hypothetical protein
MSKPEPPSGPQLSQPCPETRHCIDKIRQLVADGRDDRRAILQIGYNLGRLSELTGRGREPFWDAWKDAVASWDQARLEELAQNLLIWVDARQTDESATSAAPEDTSI